MRAKPVALPLVEHPVARVMGIDPGPLSSGWVLYDFRTTLVDDHGHTANEDLMKMIPILHLNRDMLAIESMHNQKQKVGAETFDACFWAGRFYQYAVSSGVYVEKITRLKARCHVADQYAGDREVRAALVKLHGKDALKGWSTHELAALAVARTFADTRLPKIPFHP